MPRVSAWAVRLSLLYLSAGFVLGALLLVNKAFPLLPAVWGWLPVHAELLLSGWVLQLALGVAYWILPRFTGGARGSEGAAVPALAVYNLGIWLAAGGALAGLAWLALAGRMMQAGGAALFLFNLWRRVKPLAR